MEADWANLPQELVTEIAKRASTTATEYVHLQAVCRPWRRALTPHPRHLPRQAPWLMLPTRKNGTLLSFYDLAMSTTHSFELPYLWGKYVCGSSYGWLVVEHDRRVSLLNPITRSSIELPSFLARPRRPKRKRSYIQQIKKAMLSCNPSEPGCCVVARFLSSKCQLRFCRIGDSHWTELKVQNLGFNQVQNLGFYLVPNLGSMKVHDFTCQNNLVYTINNKNLVTIYDLQNLSASTFASNIYFSERVYLVEGDEESGGPFVVSLGDPNRNSGGCVFKWFSDGQPKWRHVRDIGKRVLFVNPVKPWYTFSSANLQLDKWPGNQICYDVWHYDRLSCNVDIHVVNLKRRVENIVRSVGVYPTASVLTRRSKTAITFWFTPSLI